VLAVSVYVVPLTPGYDKQPIVRPDIQERLGCQKY